MTITIRRHFFFKQWDFPVLSKIRKQMCHVGFYCKHAQTFSVSFPHFSDCTYAVIMCAATGMIHNDMMNILTSYTSENGSLKLGNGENKNRHASLLHSLPHMGSHKSLWSPLLLAVVLFPFLYIYCLCWTSRSCKMLFFMKDYLHSSLKCRWICNVCIKLHIIFCN